MVPVALAVLMVVFAVVGLSVRMKIPEGTTLPQKSVFVSLLPTPAVTILALTKVASQNQTQNS